MNKIFKVVWSKVRNAYVVVSETAKANSKSSVKCQVGRASIAAVTAAAVLLGGGTALAADGSQTVSDTRITAGSGTFSDTIYSGIKTTSTNIGGVMNVSGKAVFDNCDFIGNSLIHEANSNGGVLYVGGSGDLTITNSTIKNNYIESTANRAYGAFLSNAGKVTIDNAAIETNLAKGAKPPYGVVINCSGAGSETNISNTTFTNSWSFKDADGNTRRTNGKDVIYMNGGTLNLENVSFSGMGISNYINGQANSGASMNKINLSGNNSFGWAMGRALWNRGVVTFEEGSTTIFNGGIEIENGNDAGAVVNIEKDASITMKSGITGKGTVNINGGTLNGKIGGTNEVNFDGGEWNLNGNSTVVAINGSSYDIAGTGTQTLTVKNTKNTSDDASDGIYSDGDASISDLEKLDVTSASRHALEAASKMEITDIETVKLTSSDGGDGIHATGDLDISNVDELVVTAQSGNGISADGTGSVDIDVEDLTVTAAQTGKSAMEVTGGASIDAAATGTGVVNGDLNAANGTIKLTLSGEDSSLTGAVKTSADGMTELALNDGASWNVTGQSTLSSLTGDRGTIAVEQAQEGLVTIESNTNQDLSLVVANGGNLGVDIAEGLQELKKTVVDGSNNSLIKDIGATNVDLQAESQEVGGIVTTTIKTGDNLVIESNVIAAGDVIASDGSSAVSLLDTAQQVDANTDAIKVNADAIKANADEIAVNSAGIAANKAAIAQNAQNIATVNNNLVTAVDAINQNVADGFNAINQNVADGFNTINGVIAQEVQERTAADNALQGQIDTNRADITANTQAIGENSSAIAGLNSRFGSLDNRVDKVGAGAAALAALHPLDYDADNKLSFAAGVGNYAGATAAAVGAFYRPNEDVMLSIGGTAGNGENMVNAGISFAIGKGSSGVAAMSKAQLAQEVTDLKAENKELKEENKDIRNELNKLKELVMQLAAKQ